MIIFALGSALKNPFLLIYLLVGVGWIAISTIIRLNIKNKNGAAYTLYSIVRGLFIVAYLIGLVFVILIIAIMSRPVAFM